MRESELHPRLRATCVAVPRHSGCFAVVPSPLRLEPHPEPTHVTGMSNEWREVLITTVADAEPDHRLWMPSSSIWPFLSALATTVLFVGSIFTPWAVAWGAVPVAIGATIWFWPKRAIVQERVRTEVQP